MEKTNYEDESVESEEEFEDEGEEEGFRMLFEAINFPLDCLGCIFEFLDDFEDFMNFLLVNKHVKRYIEEVNPGACRNVKFYFHFAKNRPKQKCLFVSTLITDEPRGRSKKNLFYNGYYDMFPNLVKLKLFNTKNVTSNIFKGRQNLEYLSIENCPRIFKNLDFHDTTNLMTLKISGGSSNSVMHVQTKPFMKLKNLRRMELQNIRLAPRFSDDYYRGMASKLTILRLNKVYGFCDSTFEVLYNLEVLEICGRCPELRYKGFKYLIKLKELKVVSCFYTLNDENMLRNSLYKIPPIFTWRK